MRRIRSKLTYSNVVSTLCLALVVGGGTAYAAVEMLPKGSVGTKQIQKGAVTPSKLSKASKSALTGATGPAGAKGATGPAGAQGPKGNTGDPGQPGAAGTALGYTRIELNGVIDTGQSKNIGSMTVSHPSKGAYCINGLPFQPRNVMATTQYGMVSINAYVGAYEPECPAGTQVSVEENETLGTSPSKDAPFMLLFN